MSAQSAYNSSQAYLPGQQVIVAGVVYQSTVFVPPATSPPNSDFWEVITVPIYGALPSTAGVTGGYVLTADSGVAWEVSSGACGVSGAAGACGVSGVAGACGVSGVSGVAGACGVSGGAGACGVSGVAG